MIIIRIPDSFISSIYSLLWHTDNAYALLSVVSCAGVNQAIHGPVKYDGLAGIINGLIHSDDV